MIHAMYAAKVAWLEQEQANQAEIQRQFHEYMRNSGPVERRVYNELKRKCDVLEEENAALRRQLEGKEIADILS